MSTPTDKILYLDERELVDNARALLEDGRPDDGASREYARALLELVYDSIHLDRETTAKLLDLDLDELYTTPQESDRSAWTDTVKLKLQNEWNGRVIREARDINGGLLQWWGLKHGFTLLVQHYANRNGFALWIPASSSIDVESDLRVIEARLQNRA